MINQIFSGVPSGYEAFVLAKKVQKGHILYIASDEKKAMRTYETLMRIFPKIPVLFYPAWDTVPYDRTSPSSDIVGNQLDTLIQMQRLKKIQLLWHLFRRSLSWFHPLNLLQNPL